MKKIITLIIIGFFCINCNRQIITLKEPIKIYIEKDIPKTGIKIWDKQVIWVDTTDNPDVMIIKTNKLPDDKWFAMEQHFTTILGQLKKPCYIYVKKINNIVIAHEFGHLLGYDENCKDKRSIMCPSYAAIHKPLNWFTEFKDK